MSVRPSIHPSVNFLCKSLLLPDKWLDCHQTCPRITMVHRRACIQDWGERIRDTSTFGNWNFTKIANSVFPNFFPLSIQFSSASQSPNSCELCHSSHGETVCQTVCYTVRSDTLSLRALTLWSTITLSFQTKYQADR